MQNVNKSSGLLNEKAPTNHNYINPRSKCIKIYGWFRYAWSIWYSKFYRFWRLWKVSQAASRGEFGGGSPEDTFGGGGDDNFINGE